MGNLIAKKENRFMTDQIVELEEKIIKDFLKKNKYEYLLALGKGEFSQVIKAFSEKTQCLVAIKFMKQIKGQSTIDLQDLEKELKIVQNLKNERYVLQIVEKIQDDQQGLVAIVTELCNCNIDYQNYNHQDKLSQVI